MKCRTFLILSTVLMLGKALFASECGTFVLEGSALFFKPHENGLAYGTLTKGRNLEGAFNPVESPGNFCFETEVLHPKFDWDTGFRLGIGYQPQALCLLFSTNWMHFKGQAENKTEAFFSDFKGEMFIGNFSAPVAPFVNNSYLVGDARVVAKAKADFDFCLDMVDVDAGYALCLTQCLNLTPYMGVRIGSINQKFCLHNTYDIVSFGEFDIDEKIKFKNYFSGAGLLFGLSADYGFSCGLSFFGSVEAALLKGHFKLREFYFEDIKGTTSFSNVFCQREKLNLQRTVADLKFGANWESCICCIPFMLTLAWEQHLYYGQNQIRPIALAVESGTWGVDQSNRGDLGLNGVSLTLQLTY